MGKSYCYVGDVLGYKYMVEHLTLDEQVSRVSELIKFVEDATKKYNITDEMYRLISDTIIIVTEKNDGNLENLLSFAQYMLNEGVPNSFPLRGGIAQGDAKFIGNVPLGAAFLEAYNLANDQNWIGTCVCKRMWDNIKKFCSIGGLVVNYKPPMKHGDAKFMPVISWNIPFYGELYTHMVHSGLGGQYHKLDWRELIKIQNTLMFSMFLNMRDTQSKMRISQVKSDKIEIAEEDVLHNMALDEQDPSWALDAMVRIANRNIEQQIAEKFAKDYWPNSWLKSEGD